MNPTLSQYVERSNLIERKIQQLKQQRVKKKSEKNKNDKTHSLLKLHTGKEVYTNNAHIYDFQEEVLQTTQSIETHQIEVIMDTGATFSMLPGRFEFAWTDLKPCLHTIEGCFKGGSTNDQTQMGEFHALTTLSTQTKSEE